MHSASFVQVLALTIVLTPVLVLVGLWVVFGALYVVTHAVRSLHHPRARRS